MKLLKKQGVAWVIVAVMILFAIGMGSAKAPPKVEVPGSVGPGDSAVMVESFYVYDDAGVLSAKTEEQLTRINRDLCEKLDVLVAVVTTNYGGDDLYGFTVNYADSIGLGDYDFIVMLDIAGRECGLLQGPGLMDWFTDEDCWVYAEQYLWPDFDRGNYDSAVLTLVKALEHWYYENG